MPQTWRLAKSLTKLRTQIDAMVPGRNKASDGSVGDLRHSARASDHNPNSAGIVTAIDVTHDPAHSVDGKVLSEQLTKDSRTKYVIFSGRIWKARTGKWEAYRGANAHNHHVHVSVKPESADDLSPWILSDSQPQVSPQPTPMPLLKLTIPHMKGESVKLLQEELTRNGFPVVADSIFGHGTDSALRKFQSAKGLTVDGICGKNTWSALR